MFNNLMEYLEQTDTVTLTKDEYDALLCAAKQRTGHWIKNAEEYQRIDPPYICEECGNMSLRATPYCSQCGAKMQ